MSEFVGRTDDEVVEGIVVVCIARFLNDLLYGSGDMSLLGSFEVDFEFIVKDSFKRLVEKRNVAALYGLTVKIVRYDKMRRVGVEVEIQRLDTANPCVVGNLGDFVLTVGADKLPRVVK